MTLKTHWKFSQIIWDSCEHAGENLVKKSKNYFKNVVWRVFFSGEYQRMEQIRENYQLTADTAPNVSTVTAVISYVTTKAKDSYEFE